MIGDVGPFAEKTLSGFGDALVLVHAATLSTNEDETKSSPHAQAIA
jgi:hypothetical protein